jgi:hypothetical protein
MLILDQKKLFRKNAPIKNRPVKQFFLGTFSEHFLRIIPSDLKSAKNSGFFFIIYLYRPISEKKISLFEGTFLNFLT